MKLSTKTLFITSKKLKNKFKKKVKLSPSSLATNTTSNQSSSPKKGKLLKTTYKKNHTAGPKTNPFNKDFIKSENNKIFTHKKIKSFKEQNLHFNLFKSKEIINKYENYISDFNNMNFNTEPNSINQNKEEYDIEALIKIFKSKSSKLKKTIIMDNNGNNNLNSEQKQFIVDCFDKKEKLEKNVNKYKINSIKVQKYNNNNISSKQNNNVINKINKRINLKFKNINFNFVHDYKNGMNTDRYRKINTRKHLLSTKDNTKFKEFFNFEERKENDIINFYKSNDDKESNSIFENYNNKSFDSSFLDSSLAENFLENIDDNNEVKN